jgi:serine/threonine protein kinase/ABC-type phosphate transport system substrate-binding protein
MAVARLSFLLAIVALSSGGPASDAALGANANIYLTGMGDDGMGPLMGMLTAAYSYVRPYVSVSFAYNDSIAVIDAAYLETDFSGFVRPIPQEALDYFGIVQFPVAGKALVVAYNVPEANGTALVIDRGTLAAIWLGNVTRWDDPRLAALNPTVALPPRQIVIGYAADSILSHTATLGVALSSFSPAFADVWNARTHNTTDTYVDMAPAPAFPASSTARISPLGGERVRWLASQPYGLTYVDRADMEAAYGPVNALPGQAVAYMAMRNRAGALVQPSDAAVQSAMADFDHAYDRDMLTVEIVDPPGDGSWPLSYVVFLALGNDQQRYCERMFEVLRFVAWTLTNDGATATAASTGTVPLEPNIKGRVLDRLNTLRCNGQQAFPAEYVIMYGPPAEPPLAWLDKWSRSQTTGIYYPLSSDDGLRLQASRGGDAGWTVSGVDPHWSASISDLAAVPLAAFALVPAYNLRLLPGAPADAVVAFDAETLAAIYMGGLTAWNDARLAALNPSLAPYLPTEPITVVVHDYESDYNLILTRFLSDRVPAFAAAVGVTPHPRYDGLGPADGGGNASSPARAAYVRNPFGVYPVLNDIEGSFAVWPAFGIGLTTRTSSVRIGAYAYAATTARGGTGARATSLTVVQPDEAALLAAVKSHVDALGAREGALAAPPLVTTAAAATPGAWPLTAFLTVAYRGSTMERRSKAAALADFIYWTQTSDEAADAVGSAGLVLAWSEPRMAAYVLHTLANFNVNGTAVSAVAGCVNPVTGFLCSDGGTCSAGSGTAGTGRCLCETGRRGAYCESAADSSGIGTDVIVGLSVALPAALVLVGLCALAMAAFAIVAVARRARRPDETWRINMEELEMGDVIGNGAYGTVHKAVWKGTDVAVKVLGPAGGGGGGAGSRAVSESMRRDFEEEVRVMTALRHPNVVLFMAACTKPPRMCIVMEFMSLGSLFDLLHNEFIPSIPGALVTKMAYQAAKGMHFLHSSGVVHRDLKSLNILLDAKWNVKISDFGLTKFKADLARNGNGANQTVVGTLQWTAPEVLDEQPDADPMLADVYSFGIIMWEMATREQPYAGLSPAAVAVGVMRDGLRPDFPEHMNRAVAGDGGADEGDDVRAPTDRLPDDYIPLAKSCWSEDPMIRPSFLEIMTRLSTNDATGDSATMRTNTSSSSSSSTSSLSPFGNGPSGVAAVAIRRRAAMTSTSTMTTASSSSSSSSPSSASDRWSPATAMTAADNVSAPDGTVTLAVSDMADTTQAWTLHPVAMCEATLLHNTIARRLLVRHRGYEVDAGAGSGAGEGTFYAAFDRASAALAWCAELQEALVAADWPKALSDVEGMHDEEGLDGRPLYRGPRVRMGVARGSVKMSRDVVTRRARYAGPTFDRAVRLARWAHGGQVLVDVSVHKAILQDKTEPEDKTGEQAKGTALPDGADHPNAFEFDGIFAADGRDVEDVYQLIVPGLRGRFFDGTTQADPATGEGPPLASADRCGWILADKAITIKAEIGHGSYGTVFKGVWKGTDVAVKRLARQRMDEEGRLRLRAEAGIMAGLNHPNVVTFVGARTAGDLCIVTELVPGGHLGHLLADRQASLPWPRRMALLLSAARGLAYLHGLERPIVHRDVKPSNLLLANECTIKIADFGFARVKEDNATMTRCGTPCWTAPEILGGARNYDEKVDVYSFGIVAWQVVTRREPFAGRNFVGVTLDVLEGKRPKIPSDCPPAMRTLIEACWDKDPKARPSIDHAVAVLEKEHTEALSCDGNKAGARGKYFDADSDDSEDEEQKSTHRMWSMV